MMQRRSSAIRNDIVSLKTLAVTDKVERQMTLANGDPWLAQARASSRGRCVKDSPVCDRIEKFSKGRFIYSHVEPYRAHVNRSGTSFVTLAFGCCVVSCGPDWRLERR